MTRSDRLGKWIARELYQRAMRQPNWQIWRHRADAFGHHWPWSWCPDKRPGYLSAAALLFSKPPHMRRGFEA